MVKTRSMRKSAAVSPEIKGGQKKNVEQKATPKTKKAGGAIPEKDHEMYRARLAAVKAEWKAKNNGRPMPGGTITTRVKKSKKKDKQIRTRNTRPLQQPRETAPRPQVVMAMVEQRTEATDVQCMTRETDSRRTDVEKLAMDSEVPKHACAMVTAITVTLFFWAMGWVPSGQSWTPFVLPPGIVEPVPFIPTNQELWVPQAASKEFLLALPSSPANVSPGADTILSPAPVVEWPSAQSYSIPIEEESGPFFPSPVPVVAVPHPTVVVSVVKTPPKQVPAVVVVLPTVDVLLPEPVEITAKPMPVMGRKAEKDMVWVAAKWIVKWTCWVFWKIVRFVVVHTLKTLWGSYGPNVRWCLLLVCCLANWIEYYVGRETFRREHLPFIRWAKALLRSHPTKRFSADELVAKYQREEYVRLNNIAAHLFHVDKNLRRSSAVEVCLIPRNGKAVYMFSDISCPR